MDGFPVLGESWKYRAQGNHSDIINVLLILGGKTRRCILLLSLKYLVEISKSEYRAETINPYNYVTGKYLAFTFRKLLKIYLM